MTFLYFDVLFSLFFFHFMYISLPVSLCVCLCSTLSKKTKTKQTLSSQQNRANQFNETNHKNHSRILAQNCMHFQQKHLYRSKILYCYPLTNYSMPTNLVNWCKSNSRQLSDIRLCYLFKPICVFCHLSIFVCDIFVFV